MLPVELGKEPRAGQVAKSSPSLEGAAWGPEVPWVADGFGARLLEGEALRSSAWNRLGSFPCRVGQSRAGIKQPGSQGHARIRLNLGLRLLIFFNLCRKLFF